jgi:hypothetical protein
MELGTPNSSQPRFGGGTTLLVTIYFATPYVNYIKIVNSQFVFIHIFDPKT